jgi:uroporphyrin-3 C-methyltransferase
MVLRLGSLESALGSLPLDQQIPDRYGREATSEDQVSGLQRAWESVKAALLSIISVRRTDQAETLLLSADEEGLLRRGMITELQIAQLALIRGEPAVYRYMLESVTRQLNRHFDQDAPAVQAALAQLETLAAASLPEDLPDISGSLELLRRHESAESP